MKESYSENSFSWHFVTKLFEEFIREKCTNFAIVEEIEQCQNFKTLPKNFPLGQINVMTRNTGCSIYIFSSKECEKRPGCTGFDLTPDEDLKNGKERCILFGHDGIEVADSISFHKSRCFR